MQALSEIKRMRVQLGLTQNQLAKQSGFSQSLIAKIESGILDPGYTKAARIFETLASLSNSSEQKAKDIMTKKILFVSPETSALELIQTMRKTNISQAPVIKDGRAIGLVSEKSLLDKIATGLDLSKASAEDVMKEAPPIVSGEIPLTMLIDLLKISPLALIAEKGEFKGVVTRTDLLKAHT